MPLRGASRAWIHSSEPSRAAIQRTMSIWPISFPVKTESQLWKAGRKVCFPYRIPHLTCKASFKYWEKEIESQNLNNAQPFYLHLLPHSHLLVVIPYNTTCHAGSMKTRGVRKCCTCFGKQFNLPGLTCERPLTIPMPHKVVENSSGSN